MQQAGQSCPASPCKPFENCSIMHALMGLCSAQPVHGRPLIPPKSAAAGADSKAAKDIVSAVARSMSWLLILDTNVFMDLPSYVKFTRVSTLACTL